MIIAYAFSKTSHLFVHTNRYIYKDTPHIVVSIHNTITIVHRNMNDDVINITVDTSNNMKVVLVNNSISDNLVYSQPNRLIPCDSNFINYILDNAISLKSFIKQPITQVISPDGAITLIEDRCKNAYFYDMIDKIFRSIRDSRNRITLN